MRKSETYQTDTWQKMSNELSDQHATCDKYNIQQFDGGYSIEQGGSWWGAKPEGCGLWEWLAGMVL